MVKAIFDKSKINDICERNDIIFLGLFGSLARGEEKPQSDIDLLAKFSKRKSLLDLVRIEREIEDALGGKVDLLTESSVSPYIKENIERDMVPLYGQ